MKSYSRFVGAFLIIVGVAASIWILYNNYFSNAAQIRRAVDSYQRFEKKYVEAMTADTYGGKTPEATLDLFVKALRAGDVELASKYFMLDEKLSRENGLLKLQNIKDRGFLEGMVNDITTKSVAVGDANSKDDFAFILYNKDGTVGIQMDMKLNDYSKVWKIERF